MNLSSEDAPEDAPAAKSESNSHWKIQLSVLCFMLLLALVGMGLTQALEKGAWEYWLVVVTIYAGLGHWRCTKKAKRDGQNVGVLIGRELAHWTTLLAFMLVVLLLERREIISRESASDFALTLLALTCCLAGIHFDGMFMAVGVVLVVMVMAMATLEQYTIALWVVVILVAVGTLAYFYLKWKRGGAEVGPIE